MTSNRLSSLFSAPLLAVLLFLAASLGAVAQPNVKLGLYPVTGLNELEVRILPDAAWNANDGVWDARITVRYENNAGITLGAATLVPGYWPALHATPSIDQVNTDGGYTYVTYAIDGNTEALDVATQWAANVERPFFRIAYTNSSSTCLTAIAADDLYQINNNLEWYMSLFTSVPFGITGDVDDGYIPGDAYPVKNTTTGEQFCSIQSAIDDSQTLDGHTITVAAGTYTENVTVSKRLTIDGAGSVGGTHVNGGITINASGTSPGARLVVKDLSVTNTIPGGNGVSINPGYDHIELNNVKASNNAGSGIVIAGGALTEGLVFTNCVINDNGTGAVGTGIRMGSGVNIDGFTITGGEIKRNAQIGFSYNSSSSAVGLTNLSITGTVFEKNGIGMYATSPFTNTGSGDISLFSWNGNATLTNVTVIGADNAGDPAGAVAVQFRGSNTPAASGTVTVNGLSITGHYKRIVTGTLNTLAYGLFIQNYSDVSNISLSNVVSDLGTGHALFAAGLTNQLQLGNSSLNAQGSTYGHLVLGTSTQNPVLTNVNATGATFGGVLASSASNAQLFAIEDKVVDRIDVPGLGLARIKTGQVFVTANSFIAPATTTPSIQRGVDAATAGDILNVQAATYAENVTIAKALDIRGPNYGIDPNTGSRVAEAIVVPGTSLAGGEILMVKASNVSINGFTIDGDNTLLTSGWIGTNGADINAAEGVTIYDATPVVNNLVVTNNIIQNLSYFGVTLFGASNYSDANTSKTGHAVTNNKIRNLGHYGVGNPYDNWGGGVLLYNSHYAHVADNVMTNVRIGIQTGNFQTAHVGLPLYQTIDNNQIQTRYSGIFFNLHNFSPWTVSDNTITGLDNAVQAGLTTRPWRGMLIASLGNNMGTSTFSNNTIDGSGITLFTTGKEGMNVWNVQNNAAASITGGTISGVSTGIHLNNYDGYNSDGTSGAHATISGVTISASSIGIRVNDSPSSVAHANVQATVSNCAITGGTDAVKLEEASAGKATGTVNNNSFTGFSSKAINATTTTNLVNAECNWYGANSQATVLAAINGNVDALPFLTNGTDNSPAAGFQPVPASCTGLGPVVNTNTGLSYFTIQAAIDDALTLNNHTITVAAGTYTEFVTVSKTLSLQGPNAAIDPCTGTRVAEAIVRPPSGTATLAGTSSPVITVSANDVIIEGFMVDGDNTSLTSPFIANGANPDVDYGISAEAPAACNNVLVRNNIVKNIFQFGVVLGSTGSSSKHGRVLNNKIDNVPYWAGVVAYDDHYAQIDNNCMTNVWRGVQTNNHYQAAPPATTVSISNNTITTGIQAIAGDATYNDYDGILHNLQYANASTWTIANNTITNTSLSNTNADCDGIEFWSIQSGVSTILSNNTIIDFPNGYTLWNCPTTSTVTVTGGSVSNAINGIVATNSDNYGDASTSSYVVDGVTLTNCATGIRVTDSNSNTNGATVSVTVQNNTAVSGAGTGVHLEGAGASVAFSGATPCSFTGSTTYLQEVSNGTDKPATAIDATAVSFDGQTGVTATNAQLFAIEDKIFHRIDDAQTGLVTVKANTLHVTDIATGTATNNDYLRIKNAVEATSNNGTINLSGTFDWTEANANASWVLGNDGVASTGDDYGILIPANLNGVTFTAPAGLGTATIQGPGDLAALSLEGALYFDGAGDNQNWTISNIDLQDFDMPIGMFFGAGGTDSYNGTTITGNHFLLPADLNAVLAPADNFQNIGIHFSFGTNQTISNNVFDVVGSGTSNGLNYSTTVVMQSNTSGGAVYDGLLIDNNTVNVTGTLDAQPSAILGFWENAHAHVSNITVSNNDFNNLTGANASTNLMRAFRVTSHSGAGTTVTYSGNTASGANMGMQWIAGSNFSAEQPVVVSGSSFSACATGLLVQSNGKATLSGNDFDAATDNTIDVDVVAGSVVTSAGTNQWAGDNYYVRNNSASAIPLLSDSFDESDNFRRADRVYDALDNAASGLVRYTATDLYVSGTGTGSSDETIQRGVDASTAGQVLYVETGNFNEQVLVNKSLTVLGVGTKPVLNFTGAPALGSGRLTMVEVTSPNVRIENLAFQSDLSKMSSVILASASNVSNLTVKDNTFTPYRSLATYAGPSYTDRNAININHASYRVSGSNPSNLLIEGNTVNYVTTGFPDGGAPFFTGAGWRGAVACDEGGGSVTGNTLASVNQDIIFRFTGAGALNITSNTCTGGGIQVTDPNAGGGPIAVSNNTFNGSTSNTYTSMLRLKNNYTGLATTVSGNTFTNTVWAAALENYQAVSVTGNTFTPAAGSTTFRHLTVNTKEISSSSGFYPPVVDLLLQSNTFNGSGTPGGTGVAFYNHDNDSPVFGTFTVGGAGALANIFKEGIGTFVRLDNSIGASTPSGFPEYVGSPVTTMACWTPDIEISENLFDVTADAINNAVPPGSLSAGDYASFQAALFDKQDDACVGKLTALRLRLDVEAFMEGAYDSGAGLMNDDLRDGLLPVSYPLIPTGHPYSGAPWSYAGTETVSPSALAVTGNDAIVDWVLLELRNAVTPATIIARRAALVQRDGDIVDTDGVSPVSFLELPNGAYHVAVRHRNHLGVMTGASVMLSPVTTTIDFTNTGTVTYGTNAQKTISGANVMWTGNSRPDNRLKYTGPSNDRDPILVRVGGITPTAIANGYFVEDNSMDGQVKYTGSQNDREYILVNILPGPITGVKLEQLP